MSFKAPVTARIARLAVNECLSEPVRVVSMHLQTGFIHISSYRRIAVVSIQPRGGREAECCPPSTSSPVQHWLGGLMVGWRGTGSMLRAEWRQSLRT